MPSISHKRITSPSELGGDGIGLADGQHWEVSDCIIDFTDCDLEDIDENIGVTWGSSATFKRCVIRGGGKLVLCGCGADDKVPVETGKRVSFYDCVLENFGRRAPEVQDGMFVDMHNCLIRNWGDPDRFTTRNFGSWAHRGGRIDAYGCVYWQDTFLRPLGQFLRDLANQIGEAWNTEGFRGLLRPSTYIPGICKGLLATDGGEAYAWQCYKNHWWIALPFRHTTEMMDKTDAKCMVAYLNRMAAELDAELPK